MGIKGTNRKKLAIMLFVASFVVEALILFLFSCDRTNQYTEQNSDSLQTAEKLRRDSIRIAKEIAAHETYPKITYSHDSIKNLKELYRLLWKFRKSDSTMASYRVFTTLNRKEMRYIRVGQNVTLPDSVTSDMKAYSVFPQYYPGAVKLKKLIMLSNRYMCYACYEQGKLVRFAACNPGKERTPSYPGRYALTWKERLHLSSLDSNWVMPYTFNFHSEAGCDFHQFEMPGYPASHSCVRQFMEDAAWLYYWGEGTKRDSNGKLIPMSGTPIVIIDHYDFHKNKGRLWTQLNSNKDILLNLPRDPMAVDEALIPICQIPEVSRGRLRNKHRYIIAEDSLRKIGVIREGVQLIQTQDFNKQRRLKAAKLEKKKKSIF